jgi:tetratricopeptide (TPR) repeat protein
MACTAWGVCTCDRASRVRQKRFQSALALAQPHEHPLHISNSLTELAALRLRTGDLDAAEALTERALAMREQHRLQAAAVTSCLRLAEIRIRRSRFEQARQLLLHALAIAEDLQVKPKIAQVHEALSSFYEQMHDSERSLAHYKRFHELREQIEREDNAKSLADARAIFEAEQTRKENVVIKQQKAEIERQNRALQETIDELTRAKIGRKAKAFTHWGSQSYSSSSRTPSCAPRSSSSRATTTFSCLPSRWRSSSL